jgi:uncharacterized protein (TIGR02217 family)
MTMIDARMSEKAERGFSVVRGSSTRVKDLKNGHERRNANWTGRKRRYTARYAGWTFEMREDLIAQNEVAEGMLYSFRFKDWLEWRVTGQSLGVAPSGTAAVQLVKTYTKGSTTKTRNITKPRGSTVTVYQADGSGNPVAKPGTLDENTGLFTPSTAWTAGRALTWTGEFDVCVRFATDEPEFILPDREICEVVCELVEVFGE